MAGEQCIVVIIDDDPGDAELLRRQLDEIPTLNMDFVHYKDTSEALLELTQRDAYVIFLDYQLGKVTGSDVLGWIRGSGDLRPIIVLTGQGDESIAAELMRSGADDYLVKDDITPTGLRRAIANARAQFLRRRGEEHRRTLLDELEATKVSLEKKNRRLSELYKTAHEFVDNVSHEFRTPLTVIKEFASIVRDGLAGDVTDEQREYLDIVNNRVDDLSIMVDDMLDISKLEAGILGVCRRLCRVDEIVERVRTTLMQKASASKISLDIAVDDDLPAVFCDPEKIGRVMINLVVNSLKFSRESERVELWARQNPAESQIIIGVSDNGPGIAPENVRSIFERFKQVGGDVRSSTKGFGLGLNIAKELVHINFGDIKVESEVGKGSTFSFTVPTADPSAFILRYLDRIKQFQNSPVFASLLTARVDEGQPSFLIEDVGQFLQHEVRPNDLVFHVKPNAWLLVVASNDQDTEVVINRIQRALTETNRNRFDDGLPPIAMSTKGVWRIEGQNTEFVQRFKEECHIVEICNA